MLERLKSTLLYAGADRSSIKRILPEIRKTNRTMLGTLSIIAALLIGTMLIFSFTSPGLRQNRMVYIIGSALSVAVFLLSFVAKNHDWLVNPLAYVACSIYYVYGIFLGTVTEPEGKTVTFIVMLVIMPILFIERPLKTGLTVIFYDIVFICLCLINKTGKVQTIDIIDGVLFGILGIASGTVVNQMKVRGYISEQKVREISRVDQLTGVNNRNAYELDLFSVPEGCKHNLACVYIDVNGLHELNNKKGHKAGDIMLTCVAEQIKKQFPSGTVYRIGGDEFLVFIPDTSRADVGYNAIELTKAIEEKGYHVAIGYETAGIRYLSIDDLVKTAEVKMFMDKTIFYKNMEDRDVRRKN